MVDQQDAYEVCAVINGRCQCSDNGSQACAAIEQLLQTYATPARAIRKELGRIKKNRNEGYYGDDRRAIALEKGVKTRKRRAS
ncbi:MAG: hypothetical protein AAF661_04920 [Pseudomonadota bacterium]